MSKRFLLLIAAMILCMSVFVGCSGDDGKDGVVDQTTLDRIAELEEQINGDPNSPEVPGLLEQIELLKQQLAAQAGANIVKEETCSTCHDVYGLHSNKYLSTTGLVEFTNNWAGEITDVAVDTGANTATITFSATNAGAALTTLDADATGGTRTVKIFSYDTVTSRWSLIVNLTNQTYAHTTGGVYTVTVTDADLTTATIANPLLVTVLAQKAGASTAIPATGNLKDGFTDVKILAGGTVSGFNSAANPRNYVSDESDEPSCIRCHGDGEFNYHHNNSLRATAEDCFACHNGRSNEQGGAFLPPNASNSALVVRVHGVHTSGDLGEYAGYEVHLPTSASDCALCHTTEQQQELIYSEENFRIEICATCHRGTNPFDTMTFGHTAAAHYNAHRDNYTGSYADCALCHGDTAGWAYVRDNLHKYFDSRSDAGAYTYTDLNKSWTHEYVIDGITVDNRTVTVDWYVQEKDGGAKVDVLASNPEYAFIRTGSYVPGFTIGYSTGDDWTNEGVGNAAAQPGSMSFNFTANNVEAVGGGVFRTAFTIPEGVDTTIPGRKGIVALRGVPTTMTKLNATDNGNVAYVYVDTVTREFNLTDGSLPANLRRVTATFEGQCKACHDHLVGHGHSYVNNIDVCMVCHNPSATEKNVRIALDIDSNNAADGKDEESYDLRYMLHRIHSVAYNDNDPYVVYRTRGVYGFYYDEADAAAFPAHVENQVQIHYPRPVTACGACHDFTQGFHGEASLKAAPLTLKQGDDLTTEGDDTVISPHAGACISCHSNNEGHAAQQSYYVTLIKGIFTKLNIVNK